MPTCAELNDPEGVDWDFLQGIEDPKPDYDNSGPFDIHMKNDELRVLDAARAICAEIKYTGARAVTHMAMVLLNLYRAYLMDPERWLGYSRDMSKYNLIFRYNRQRITYRPLIQVMDGLAELDGYIEEQPGYYDSKTETGKCTRVRATGKLIEWLVGNHKWTPEVLKWHENEEVIILKDAKKRRLDYDDNDSTEGMRQFLREYNQFIERTYVDLDWQGYQPKHTVYVDLTKKHIRRIFNNGSFQLGGRFYGGWWIGIPSELRLRIIINNQKVAECDYSNMSIHLLYMREGIDYSKYGRDAYTLPDYGDDKKTRGMFKVLLLAMLCSGSEKAARGALQEDINFNRDNYPEVLPDLKQVVQDFTEYHQPIAKHFYERVGLEVMHQDSVIAETIMRKMMHHGIPVLPVHDSFICPKKHADLLQDEMLAAYQLHVPEASKYKLPRIGIKYDELHGNDMDDECYYYDILSVMDSALLERMILHDRTGGLPVMYQIKLQGTMHGAIGSD